MELFKQFGIEPVLLIAQIVNFLIILFLLKKFLYKPVQNLLSERKKTIKEGLEKAEEGRLLLEKARLEEKEILKKAQEKSEKIIENAKNQALELVNAAKEEVKIETQRMIGEAKDQIQKEADKIQDSLISHVSALSVDFLKKALSQTLDKESQKEILNKTIHTLKKSN